MKTTLGVKRGRRFSAGSRKLQNVIEKSKRKYKWHLVRVLGEAQQTTSRQLWALDVLSSEGARGDGFPLIAAEAARLSHYKPRRSIAGPEICPEDWTRPALGGERR